MQFFQEHIHFVIWDVFLRDTMVYLVRNPVPGIVPVTYEAFAMQFNQIMGKTSIFTG